MIKRRPAGRAAGGACLHYRRNSKNMPSLVNENKQKKATLSVLIYIWTTTGAGGSTSLHGARDLHVHLDPVRCCLPHRIHKPASASLALLRRLFNLRSRRIRKQLCGHVHTIIYSTARSIHGFIICKIFFHLSCSLCCG